MSIVLELLSYCKNIHPSLRRLGHMSYYSLNSLKRVSFEIIEGTTIWGIKVNTKSLYYGAYGISQNRLLSECMGLQKASWRAPLGLNPQILNPKTAGNLDNHPCGL